MRYAASLLISVLLGTAAITPTSSATVDSVSLYGVTLGAPITVPECGVPASVGMTCWGEAHIGGTIANLLPSPVKNLLVYFPYDGQPGIAKYKTFDVWLMDGKVESIIVLTNGLKSQEAVLRQLTQKFGKPSAALTKTVQNGFGAKFEYADVTWSRPAAEIQFKGLDNGVDTGSIIAMTPKYLLYMAERDRTTRKAEPRL